MRKRKIYPSECRVPKNSKGDKKAFLSEQFKATEENNTMGKTRDLLKKTGDIKGTFHVRMIKDRNDKELIETEEIKKKWQEYTEQTAQKRS